MRRLNRLFRFRKQLAILAVVSLIPRGVHGQGSSTVFGFESFTDGTYVTTQLSGLALTGAITLSGTISLNELEFPPRSGSNVISDSGGPITITFATPATEVSGYFTYTVPVTMVAFNSLNVPVGTATTAFASNLLISGDPGSTPNERLAVTAAGGISRVTITGAAGGGSFALDDLTVSPAIGGATSTDPLPDPPLTITSPLTLRNIPLGGSLSTTLTASGGVAPYVWSADGALPAGVQLSGAGILNGKPTQPGLNRFIVRVTDSRGTSLGIYMTFSVFAFTTSSLPPAVAFSAYSQPLAVTGGLAPYTFTGSGFPAGLSVSTGGNLIGTPSRAGDYKLVLQATDAEGLVITTTLSLTVTPPAPLSFTSPTVSATAGTRFVQGLTATGGVPPYSFLVIGGGFPGGVVLNATGTLSGTLTRSGSYASTVRATDSAGTRVAATVVINVSPNALSFNAPASLPSGTTGVDYPSQVISATGGTPPYAFSVTGALPPGLTLRNVGGAEATVIGGRPGTAGTYSFSVNAKDSAGGAKTVDYQMLIRSGLPDIQLSLGSLSFSSVEGSAALPPAQTVLARSSAPATVLRYSAEVVPGVDWLAVRPGGGSTPDGISVSLTGTALQLAASSSPYQATLVLTCQAPSPCAGNIQSIPVTLAVTSLPARLSLSRDVLSYRTTARDPIGGTLVVDARNTGGGTLGIASITSGAAWARVGAFPGSVAAGSAATVSISIDPAGLSPGFYRTTLTATTSGGVATLPVNLALSSEPTIRLVPASTEVSLVAGLPPPTFSRSLFVGTSAAAGVTWRASVLPGSSWLSVLTSSGNSTSAAPGSLNYEIVSAASAALAPGTYWGTIRVASESGNIVRDFQVELNVVANGGPLEPAIVSDGLLFLANAPGGEGTADAAAVKQIDVLSPAAGTYQLSASTADGGTWLTVSPGLFSAATAEVSRSTVHVNSAGLPPGVYRGSINYAGTSPLLRTVSVTFIVPPAGSCRPSSLVIVPLSPMPNFRAVPGRPVSLQARLVDNCGNPVAGGQITAAFSNADPAESMDAVTAAGKYAGTWTPSAAIAQVSVLFNATAPGLTPSSLQLGGQVLPGTGPAITRNGSLHIFNPRAADALVPGSIIQVYGTNLAAQVASATTIPLPLSLAGTSVTIGGVAAPLFFVSPGQINAVVPEVSRSGGEVQITTSTNGIPSGPANILVSDSSPGVAALPNSEAIATHLNGTLVSSALPAKPGEVVILYAAGLGATENPVAVGSAAPSDPLARVLNGVSVTIDAQPALVLFAGLTPGLAGLYQINVQVPTSASAGLQQVVLSQGGVLGNETVLAVGK